MLSIEDVIFLDKMKKKALCEAQGISFITFVDNLYILSTKGAEHHCQG